MMMKILGIFHRSTHRPIRRQILASPAARFLNHSYNLRGAQLMSTFSEEPELKAFTDFIDNLNNYEKAGVPKGAGTDSDDGFDLGRMRRLMQLLGNPQSKFKAVHIAGTKGKGSTAAFLSSILRAQGYSVGCYTSPHIRTIRERITLGASGDPVPAKILNHHFRSLKMVLEQAIELENGCLSHFEVLTAVAFSLFAQQSVSIAVIEAGLGGARDATNVIPSSALAASIITSIGEEHLAALGGSLESIAVAKSGIIKDGRPALIYGLDTCGFDDLVYGNKLVLGGPFLPHIEQILRDKASSMSSPVVSASDTGNRSILKSLDKMSGRPFQYCDLVLQIEKDIPLCIELCNVKLSMLGHHQLKNAATAACAALCLRGQGWKLSNESIRAGLESAFLLGRSQILTQNEAERLGLSGASILLDGAHTKESAIALLNTIEMTFPKARLVLVVAMANDKDHLGFARVLLSAGYLEAVFFTEASIAGEKSRTTLASSLRDSWIQASREKEVDIRDYTINEHENVKDPNLNHTEISECRPILFAEGSLMASLKAGGQILGAGSGGQNGVIVVTGSLHIVSSLLGSLQV